MFSDENVQRYVKALYSVAAMLLLVPLVDLTLRTFPPQFGTLQWRFATIGLLLGNLGTLMLGLGLLGLVAAVSGHRKFLRILGFVAMGVGVVLLAILVLFALDAIQMRRLANANFKRAVLMSSLGAMSTGVLGTITLFMIGRGAVTASRVNAVVQRRQVKPASPIVVQRPAAVEAPRPSASESI